MGSEYDYISVQMLEAYMSENFSEIDAGDNILLDPQINAKITMAEELINGYMLTSFTGVRGYQGCGLTGKNLDTLTGLTTATTYYFKVNVNGAGEFEYNILTGTDLTYDAIIDLMNNSMNKGAFWLINGDLRFTSNKVGSLSTVALGAGTTGTDLFVTLTSFAAFEAAVVGSGEIPISAVWATKDIGKRILYTWMREKAMKLSKDKILEADKPLFTDTVKEMLDILKLSESAVRSIFVRV